MDVEPKLIGFLTEKLVVPVRANVPAERPEKLVTVGLEGGSVDDVVVERALMTVQSWAPTQSQAKDLARDVDDVMRTELALEPWVLKVTRESFFPWPTAEGETRYQATYQLTVYA